MKMCQIFPKKKNHASFSQLKLFHISFKQHFRSPACYLLVPLYKPSSLIFWLSCLLFRVFPLSVSKTECRVPLGGLSCCKTCETCLPMNHDEKKQDVLTFHQITSSYHRIWSNAPMPPPACYLWHKLRSPSSKMRSRQLPSQPHKNIPSRGWASWPLTLGKKPIMYVGTLSQLTEPHYSLTSHSQVSNEGTLRVSLPFSSFSLGSFHVLFSLMPLPGVLEGFGLK